MAQPIRSRQDHPAMLRSLKILQGLPERSRGPVHQLEGKVALVTGRSRGIGAAIAMRFAEHGAAVAVHGRDRESVSAVMQGIEKTGGRAIDVTAELTDFPAIEAARQQIERTLGPVDILVANAGGSFTPPAPLE